MRSTNNLIGGRRSPEAGKLSLTGGARQFDQYMNLKSASLIFAQARTFEERNCRQALSLRLIRRLHEAST